MLALLRLYLIFAQIGLFTLGGGMAMLPLMQKSLVAGGLMTLRETADMVAISQMTPGPFAVNAATFAGMRLYGLPGALVATLGVITPGAVLTLLAARFFIAFHRKPMVGGALYGVRPVVVGLIFTAACSIAAETILPEGFGTMPDIPALFLSALCFVLLLTSKKISPVGLIAGCGLIGGLFLR